MARHDEALRRALAERSAGRLRAHISLSGPKTGAPTSARLVLTDSGLYLARFRIADDVSALEPVALEAAHYSTGVLSDTLELDGCAYKIRLASRGDARRLIALARLQEKSNASRIVTGQVRHVEELDELEQQLVGTLLARDELLLAWLHSDSQRPLRSPLGDSNARVCFMVSHRRNALVWIGDLGDYSVDEMRAAPLRIERRGRRRWVRVHEHEWLSRNNSKLYEEIAEVTGLTGPERLREVARLNWIHRRPSHEPFSYARYLLDAAVDRDDPLAEVTRWLVAAHTGAPLPESSSLQHATAELSGRSTHQDALADIWQRWQLSTNAGQLLVNELRRLKAEPWALELHRRVHAAAAKTNEEPQRVEADLDLAAHLVHEGESLAAIEVLHARIAEIPPPGIEIVAPEHLSGESTPTTQLVRAYELIESATTLEADGFLRQERLRAQTALARLEPLIPGRLEMLASEAPEPCRTRAHLAHQALMDPVIVKDPISDEGVRSLPSAVVTHALKHPLAATEADLLGRLQSLLAMVPSPDRGMLRDYCEPLSETHHPQAAAALRRACIALDVPQVEAYVSRGDKAIGVRAYEHAPPFVLIGGRHLAPDDTYAMTPTELAFALGSEIAHLRYGHTRVTSSEVWAGAFHKTRGGLDIALGVLPAMRGWKLADRVAHVAERIPNEGIDRAYGLLRNLAERFKQPDDANDDGETRTGAVLSRINEELVAAHRLMQLSADRAGLALAGHPSSALRAILLVRTDYAALLHERGEDTLVKALHDQDEAGHFRWQNLLVRIAQLLEFYLSDEYTRAVEAWQQDGASS